MAVHDVPECRLGRHFPGEYKALIKTYSVPDILASFCWVTDEATHVYVAVHDRGRK